MSIDTDYTEFAICPYCGFAHTDYFEYAADDGESNEMECLDCGKEFEFVTHVTITFSSYKKEESDDEN